MSGLSRPAAFMMSTISVETTARLTICWIASSRSAALFLPVAGAALDQRRADRLEEADFIADCLRLVARRRQRERLGERQHRIGVAAVRALLALLGRLLGGVCLLQRQHPVDGPGHDRQARLRRRLGSQGRPVVEPAFRVGAEHGADDLVLLQQHRDGLGLVDAGLVAVAGRNTGRARS